MDFVVEKDNQIVQLIQVTKSIKDEKTRKRELRAFQKVKDELHLNNISFIVISEDRTEHLERGIEMINVKEWLLF